jgi:hypothetical protein
MMDLICIIFVEIRPGSGSGPSPNFGLRLGLLLNNPKGRAQMGLGFGLGPRAWVFDYLVKVRAQVWARAWFY